MPSLIVADDHPLVRDALASLFEAGGYSVVARVENGEQALAAIAEYAPDLAVIDINMPAPNGVDVLRHVRAAHGKTRVVLLTGSVETRRLEEAFRLRVDGLVFKDAPVDMLLRCAQAAIDGQPWIDRAAMEQLLQRDEAPAPSGARLTERETAIVRHVAAGLRNKEIARLLGIEEGTVKMHLHNLFRKLGVASRTELALVARREGFVAE
jgi:two-component system nitrate/nitrite response regulator NarP